MRETVASVFHSRLLKEGCLVLFAVALLLTLEALVSPRIYDVRYRYPVKGHSANVLPISIPVTQPQAPMEVWATVYLYPFQSTKFSVRGDDCLTNFDVNGTPVIFAPKCSAGAPKSTVGLKNYLQQGKNDLHFRIKDVYGGSIGLSIVPSAENLVIFILRLLQLFIPFFWLAVIVRRSLGSRYRDLNRILVAGFLLRFLYVAATAYNVRNHDVDAHIEYIQFVSQFWTVPPAAHGWEFHQGPLYYFLTAPLLSLSTLLGHSKEIGYQWIQNLSLLLSCMTLTAIAWCGSVLFDREQERRSLLLFTALMAFFPGLIMFASRINNDILFQLIAYTFLGSLLVWWKNGSRQWLIITSIVIGLGFLTKANAYLFAPVLLICIVFRSGTDTKSKFRQIAIACGIVVLMAGWLMIIRYMEHDFSRLFLRGDGMNPALRITQSWRNYMTFLPWSIVQSPYVYLPSTMIERGYFWMFFFRTSLFGEFIFSGDTIVFVSRVMVLLAMGMLITVASGLYQRIRQYDAYVIPLIVCLIIVLESAIAYVILHPSAPNQDFRFSLLILPILGYFAVSGSSGNGILPKILRAWLWSFVIVSIAFIVTTFVQYL